MNFYITLSENFRSAAYTLGIIGLALDYMHKRKTLRCTERADAFVSKEGFRDGIRAVYAFIFGVSSFHYNAGGKDVTVHGISRRPLLEIKPGQNVVVYYNPEKITDYYVKGMRQPFSLMIFQASLICMMTAIVVIPAMAPDVFADVVKHNLANTLLFPACIVTAVASHDSRFLPHKDDGQKEAIVNPTAINLNMARNGLKVASDSILTAGIFMKSETLMTAGVAGLLFSVFMFPLLVSMFVAPKTYEQFRDTKDPMFIAIISYIYLFIFTYAVFA